MTTLYGTHHLEGFDVLARDSEVGQRSQHERNLGHRDGVSFVHIHICTGGEHAVGIQIANYNVYT